MNTPYPIKVPILIAFILLSIVQLEAQVKIPESFYKHFSGSLDTNMQITLDMYSLNNKLSGYYYYSFREPGADSIVHYGKTVPFTGEKFDHSITLHEFGNKESKFSGVFQNKKKIKGQWERNAHEKSIPFEVKEDYNNGSVPLSFHTKSDQLILEQHGLQEKNCPKAKIEITLLYPKLSKGNSLKDTFDIILTKFLINDPILMSSPEILLKDISHDFFDSYKTATDGIEDLTSTASFNWEKKVSMEVKYNENNLLSIKVEKYAFTGGAHGISMSEYFVIDIEGKKRLALADIFKKGYENELALLLEKKLRRLHGLNDSERLNESGFLVEKMEYNDNFYVNNDGIGFYYNLYAIAPYSAGTTELFLKYEELDELFKTSHPFIWKNK